MKRLASVRILLALGLGTLVGASAAACANLKAALGDPCLRDDDCITTVCVAFYCRSTSDTTDTPAPPADAAVDATEDAPALDATDGE